MEIKMMDGTNSLSKYLTLERAMKSDTALRLGIDNTPDEEQIDNLRALAIHVYDKVKGKFSKVYPNSVFRSKALNDAVKGSATSQHCKGEAIDIDSPTNAYNLEVFKWIMKNVEFDQMIAEFPDNEGPSWVHVSYKKNPLLNREEILVANGTKTGAGATYAKFTGTESWYK